MTHIALIPPDLYAAAAAGRDAALAQLAAARAAGCGTPEGHAGDALSIHLQCVITAFILPQCPSGEVPGQASALCDRMVAYALAGAMLAQANCFTCPGDTLQRRAEALLVEIALCLSYRLERFAAGEGGVTELALRDGAVVPQAFDFRDRMKRAGPG